VGARLPASAKDRADFLTAELKRVPAAAEGPSALFSAAIAAEMLPLAVPDRAQIRTLLAAALSARNDPNYRRLILAVLWKTDAEGAAQLRQQFKVQ
jgi:hypothetical protein